MSLTPNSASEVAPGAICPAQAAMNGTRVPPSCQVAFLPAMSVMTPSTDRGSRPTAGSASMSAPLSEVNTISVLSISFRPGFRGSSVASR